MGGRPFDHRNEALPEAVEALAANPPACFDKPIWRLYLIDCHRGVLNDQAGRAALNRGEVPEFCSECTTGYRARMHAVGRCNPPKLKTHTMPILSRDLIVSTYLEAFKTMTKARAFAHVVGISGHIESTIEEVIQSAAVREYLHVTGRLNAAEASLHTANLFRMPIAELTAAVEAHLESAEAL